MDMVVGLQHTGDASEGIIARSRELCWEMKGRVLGLSMDAHLSSCVGAAMLYLCQAAVIDTPPQVLLWG